MSFFEEYLVVFISNLYTVTLDSQKAELAIGKQLAGTSLWDLTVGDKLGTGNFQNANLKGPLFPHEPQGLTHVGGILCRSKATTTKKKQFDFFFIVKKGVECVSDLLGVKNSKKCKTA